MPSLLTFLGLCVCVANAATVGVIPFPELGHFNPFLAVIEELKRQPGTTVVAFVPGFFSPFCEKHAGHLATCVAVGDLHHHQYDENFFRTVTISPALDSFALIEKETRQAQTNLTGPLLAAVDKYALDVILCDFGMHITGGIIADTIRRPLVLLWPLLLAMPGINTNPRVPSLGAAVPLNMSWPQYLWNLALQRLSLLSLFDTASFANQLRKQYGLPPVDALSPYSDRVILTPSIFGLDVPQQLCPNIIPVGLLQPQGAETDAIPQDWLDFFNDCGRAGNGTVYVNMGSIGRLPPHWVHMFEDALLSLPTNTCVLWKLSDEQRQSLRSLPSRPRTRLAKWLPFSPRSMLRETFVSTFVTHCGDTSVYEAVEFGVPLVGFPLFADQPDMCQRVNDAKLGIALEKFTATAQDITAAIEVMQAKYNEVALLASRLRNISALLGEAPAAARTIFAVIAHGTEPFRCSRALSNPITFFDLDVYLLSVASFLIFLRLLRSLIGRKQ